MSAGILRRGVNAARALDTRIARRSGQRRVLVDARHPVNFTMVAPVYRAMARRPAAGILFHRQRGTARGSRRSIVRRRGSAAGHPRPRRVDEIRRICRVRFHVGIAAPRDVPHPGVSRRGGKIRIRCAGSLDAGLGPAVLRQRAAAAQLHREPARSIQTAPRSASSACRKRIASSMDRFNATRCSSPSRSTPRGRRCSTRRRGRRRHRSMPWGWTSFAVCCDRPINLIVKLHDRSLDQRAFYSGGIDWPGTLRPILCGRQGVIAPRHDVSPYLIAADLMITDHSSAGFEFLLCNRPIVRIHRPELLTAAQVHPDYAALLASVSESVTTVGEALAAVDRGLANPSMRSDERRAVAADLFYRPGGATGRTIQVPGPGVVAFAHCSARVEAGGGVPTLSVTAPLYMDRRRDQPARPTTELP